MIDLAVETFEQQRDTAMAEQRLPGGVRPRTLLFKGGLIFDSTAFPRENDDEGNTSAHRCIDRRSDVLDGAVVDDLVETTRTRIRCGPHAL